MEFFMRVLTATEPDNVGGGLVFNGLFVVSNWNDRYNDFAGMGGGGGGGIDVGPRGNGGNGSAGASSAEAGYGANMVNPAVCRAEVTQTLAIGTLIGGTVGLVFGRSLPAIGVGSVAGAGLGMFYGLKTSPACQPLK
jgi:hypothetical protein